MIKDILSLVKVKVAIISLVAMAAISTPAAAAEIRFEEAGGQKIYYIDAEGPFLPGGNGYANLDTGNTYLKTAPEELIRKLSPKDQGLLKAACLQANPPGRADMCEGITSSESAEEFAQQSVRDAEYRKAGGWALRLFDFAMGKGSNERTDCLTCTFLGNFMVGLSNFSGSVFEYFQAAFSLIVPVLMLIWVAQKTIRLFVTGGEDGRSYIYSVIGKLTLFFFVWAFISVSTSTTTYRNDPGAPKGKPSQVVDIAPSWTLAGPQYLAFAFGLSNEIRDATFTNRGYITNAQMAPTADAFKCQHTVEQLKEFTRIDTIAKFTGSALDLSCSTERAHMVGISSGLALMKSSGSQFGMFDWSSYPEFVIKLITGVFLITIFGLSTIWFTFLVLDVVVRGLITAAFIPLIAGCALFKPTRYVATNAMRAMAGAVMTAVAIAIVSTLAFFLLTNTITVYNAMSKAMGEIDGIKLLPVDTEKLSLAESFRDFLVRIQQDDKKETMIPLDLHTPWFYYLALSGLAIFSLGKKIISMIEGFVGTRESSAMADNAMKLAKTGATMGMQAGTVAAAMSPKLAKGGVALTGATAGALWRGGGAEAFRALNPFGAGGRAAAAAAASAAAGSANSLAQTASEFTEATPEE